MTLASDPPPPPLFAMSFLFWITLNFTNTPLFPQHVNAQQWMGNRKYLQNFFLGLPPFLKVHVFSWYIFHLSQYSPTSVVILAYFCGQNCINWWDMTLLYWRSVIQLPSPQGIWQIVHGLQQPDKECRKWISVSFLLLTFPSPPPQSPFQSSRP